MVKNRKSVSFNGKLIERLLKFWLPVAIWAVVIFSFSSLPTIKASSLYWREFVIKKTAHIVIYAVLSTLLYRALKESGVEKKEAGIYAIILAILYGVSDEFHQAFTPGREPTARDVFFDTGGAVLAIYSLWKLLPKAPKKLKVLAHRLQLY